MIELHEDHTTPEQGKMLMAVGVLPVTANKVYADDSTKPLYELKALDIHNELFRERVLCGDMSAEHNMGIQYIPCWTVGRLIDIIKGCCSDDAEVDNIARGLFFDPRNAPIDLLVEFITLHKDIMDFSKLASR